MNQNIACPQRLRFEDAIHEINLLADQIKPSNETIQVSECAQRILSVDLIAPRAVPGFRNSAMDGFAFRYDDVLHPRLRVVGRVKTGDNEVVDLQPGECVAITTGALMPSNADTVIMIENTQVEADWIKFLELPKIGANVRAHDVDYAHGQNVATRGTMLSPAMIGVLNGFGLKHIEVLRKPIVSIINTGGELIEREIDWRPGKIFNSNGPMLQSLLELFGANVFQRIIVVDQFDSVCASISTACDNADLVLITGGASAGESDYTIRALAELGRVLFWKVKMRPGMPVSCAKIKNAIVFALPGNPVSVFATFVTLVEPILKALLGRKSNLFPTFHAQLESPIQKNHERMEFRRAWCFVNQDGQMTIRPHQSIGSSILRSVVESNALIELPAEQNIFQTGDKVSVRLVGELP